MPTTPVYALRYPAGTAPPDVPTDMQNLAVDVEGQLQQPFVRVYHNAVQTVADGVALALAFNSERNDQAFGAASTMHDNATNNSRLTCRYAGVYLLIGTVLFQNNATGYRVCRIRINGTTAISSGIVQAAPATVNHGMTTSALWPMAVNDYAELVVQQGSGSTLNMVVEASDAPEFMMIRVG